MSGRVEQHPDVVLRLAPRRRSRRGPGAWATPAARSSTAMSRWACICWSPGAAGHDGGTCPSSSWKDRPVAPSVRLQHHPLRLGRRAAPSRAARGRTTARPARVRGAEDGRGEAERRYRHGAHSRQREILWGRVSYPGRVFVVSTKDPDGVPPPGGSPMSQYLLAVNHTPDDLAAMDALTPEEMQAMFDAAGVFNDQAAGRGRVGLRRRPADPRRDHHRGQHRRRADHHRRPVRRVEGVPRRLLDHRGCPTSTPR